MLAERICIVPDRKPLCARKLRLRGVLRALADCLYRPAAKIQRRVDPTRERPCRAFIVVPKRPQKVRRIIHRRDSRTSTGQHRCVYNTKTRLESQFWRMKSNEPLVRASPRSPERSRTGNLCSDIRGEGPLEPPHSKNHATAARMHKRTFLLCFNNALLLRRVAVSRQHRAIVLHCPARSYLV